MPRYRKEMEMEPEGFREEEMPYELWLCSLPDINNRQLCRLVQLCGGAQGAYYAGVDQWRQVLNENQVEKLKAFTARWRPEAEWRKLREMDICLVTFRDSGYPERLREIPDAPYGLFFRGEVPGPEPAVAVVGARDCSRYGAFVAQKLGEMLGCHGITVVSGMARGVDGISQQAALEAGGRSWGVLGCGVDICYPRQNDALYHRLPKQGCLLSSYPPGTPALARNFPPRNRIVSGLAEAVIVVEAREKSGTLITVDMALEQGREVYAVPGRITDRLSDGCNRLIRQGAVPLLNPEELMEELAQLRCSAKGAGRDRGSKEEWPRVSEKNSGKSVTGRKSRSSAPGRALPELEPQLQAVLDTLELTPKTLLEIREMLPEKYRDINLSVCLMQLCVDNLAVQVSPGCFCSVGG